MKYRNLFILLGAIISFGIASAFLSGFVSDNGLKGLGGSLSVEKNFTGERYEYLEDRNEVRHPHWSSYFQNGEKKNISVPKVASFRIWGEAECMDLAISKLDDTVEKRAEKVASAEGITVGMDTYTELFVDHHTSRNREGEMVIKPEISYWRLVLLTPGSIECTVHVDGQTHSNTIEVAVGKAWSREV